MEIKSYKRNGKHSLHDPRSMGKVNESAVVMSLMARAFRQKKKAKARAAIINLQEELEKCWGFQGQKKDSQEGQLNYG